MKKLILLLIVILSIYANIGAEEKKFAIFFANGMFTSPAKANAAKKEIERRINSELSPGIDIKYDILYNHNENAFTQVAQVAEQEGFLDRILEEPSLLKNVLYSVLMGQIQKNEINIDGSTYIVDEDLAGHIEIIQKELDEGRIVIEVSHSQGNFYANETHQILSNENFHIVSVGNPDNYVGGNGDYVTLTNDTVINLIRTYVDPYTLPGNEINSESHEDTNHDFIESYMAEDNSRERIIENIMNLIIDPIYQIGDIGPAGGWIFYIDEANEFEWTYLEAAPIETEWTSKEWGSYGTFIEETTVEVGSGKYNTVLIASAPSINSDNAASLCDRLAYNEYEDWFLPSKNELNLMFENLFLQGFGEFANDYYWSSSEYSSYHTWAKKSSGNYPFTDIKFHLNKVRAIRFF
ncbi:hypothetical protein KAS08_00330 [Candidatus Pacearchaeota archaeon]|nr:hypothetical protein [Candidatus Pacearchaeota archaeon]